MFLRYSYQLHNAHQRPLHAHLLQELQVEAEEVEAEEVEAEEVEAEVEAEEEAEEVEEEQIPKTHLTSDSAETPLKYLREKERRQIASSPNSNAITWPISGFQNSIPGSERSLSPAPTSKALSLTSGSTER